MVLHAEWLKAKVVEFRLKDVIDGYRSNILCRENPLAPGNNIGRDLFGAA